MFWNLRHFHLEEHTLAYYDEEQPLAGNGAVTPRGVIALEGCELSLSGGILYLAVRAQKGGGFIDRARHGTLTGTIKLWHRDPEAIEGWYHALKKSIEVHEQRLLLKAAKRELAMKPTQSP